MNGNAPDRLRLAVVLSHPIQYYSPWFRYLTTHGFAGLRVFYLYPGAVHGHLDPGFGVQVKWDIPLLDGHAHEFVPNVARQPGPSHWRGLDNPELAARLAKFQPGAILLFGFNYLTHYRLLFARRRVPVLFRGDSHRLVPETGWSARLRQQWIRLVYRRVDAFLPVGQANREYFRLHGVPERKLFFTPHAVDNDRFMAEAAPATAAAAEWKRSLGIPAGHRVILFAGKFEAKKRPLDLVAAFKTAGLAQTTLLLVGNGNLETQLRQASAGRADIVFVPFQNQSQMPRTYAAGDVLVLPSFGRGETWGLAVNEAMCLSRPVIVSSHVGCAADLVRPGENGLVFPAGDVPALTQALQRALAQPGLLQQWGSRSLALIQNYDYAHAAAGLQSALNYVGHRRG